jgi:hypothetical protein
MDPKKLRKAYMQVLPHLNKALKHVQSALSDVPPSDFLLETNIKPYASAKRKMLEHRIQEPAELPDLVRGRLFFSEEYNPKEVVDLLKKVFGDKVTKANKKDTNECGLEYHGVTDVSLDCDGIQFELQLMPMSFQSHQELSHKIHDKLRSEKTKLSDKEKDFLRRAHNKLFKTLDVKSRAPKED